MKKSEIHFLTLSHSLPTGKVGGKVGKRWMVHQQGVFLCVLSREGTHNSMKIEIRLKISIIFNYLKRCAREYYRCVELREHEDKKRNT